MYVNKTISGIFTTASGGKAQGSGGDFQAMLEQQSTLLTDSFNTWKSTYMAGGISLDRMIEVDAQSDAFVALMQKAVEADAYSNPKAFLNTLSPDELATLRDMQGLVDPINPDTLTDEGALNLLLPPNMKQDIDNDGFTMTGISRGWQFPPVNAPEDVKAAWEETTEGMSPSEKMLAQGKFLILTISANIKTDANGTPIGIYEPGEDGFTNPFADPEFSYTETIKEMLASLEAFKARYPAEQYARDTDFLTRFLENLTAVA